MILRLVYVLNATRDKDAEFLSACDLDQHPFAIGCGYPTFQSIQQVFNLHETSEEAIINNNGAFARYFTRNRDSPEVESLGRAQSSPLALTSIITV